MLTWLARNTGRGSNESIAVDTVRYLAAYVYARASAAAATVCYHGAHVCARGWAACRLLARLLIGLGAAGLMRRQAAVVAAPGDAAVADDAVACGREHIVLVAVVRRPADRCGATLAASYMGARFL